MLYQYVHSQRRSTAMCNFGQDKEVQTSELLHAVVRVKPRTKNLTIKDGPYIPDIHEY